MNPKLSVVIPVYNAESYLERCITSILNQTYSNIEVILVDDGSKDGSGVLCDSYAAKHENISVIHTVNQGAGQARNTGIKASTGELIAFVDADDYIEPQMYEDLIGKLIEQEVNAVYCGYYTERKGVRKPGLTDIPEAVYRSIYLLESMIGSLPKEQNEHDFTISSCNAVYRKNIICKHNIEFADCDRCEDLIFNIQFLSVGGYIYYLDNKYYIYTQNEQSASHKYSFDSLEKEKKVYKKVTGILKKKELDEKFQLRYDRLFLGRIRICIRQEANRNDTWNIVEKVSNIKKIVNDGLVEAIIKKYPYHSNPLKLRIFHSSLKNKWIGLLFLLVKLKR